MALYLFTRETLAARLCVLVALFYCVALAGCAGSGGTTATQTATSQTTQAAVTTAPPAPLDTLPSPASTPKPSPVRPGTPPQPSEIRDALARAYQNAVTADESRGALTADFNGDGSEDIAVIVKPSAAQLSEINHEVANWIVEDPTRVEPPQEIRPGQPTPTPPAPVKVEAGDTLLAIIHGYKSAGWRNADAKQTYLLKNAVGSEMQAQTADEARRANAEHKRPLPFLRGDLIWQKLSGKTGCVYWTGAKYGWYDSPRTSAQPSTPAHDKNSPARHAP
ncbi:MAG TPA: hypothetical protein VF656_01655 [Pyrinomonadaceae bacterium]|jgi:hypothetical protein